MRKYAGKRYTKGSKGGMVIPMSNPPPEAQAAPKPLLHTPEHTIPRANKHLFRKDDEWARVWTTVKVIPDQLLYLMVRLVDVAKRGTGRGRYIRVTVVQAELVLGLILVFALSCICWVVGWFI